MPLPLSRSHRTPLAPAIAFEDVILTRDEEELDKIKKAKAAGMSEDDQKLWEAEVQEMTDRHIASVDQALERKQEEIMQV